MDKDIIAAASPDKWGEIGGLSGLVIWALFLMLAVMIWVIEKKLTALAIGQEKIKGELGEKLERVRSNIVEMMYSTGLRQDRRREDYDPDPDNQRRRKADNDKL